MLGFSSLEIKFQRVVSCHFLGHLHFNLVSSCLARRHTVPNKVSNIDSPFQNGTGIRSGKSARGDKTAQSLQKKVSKAFDFECDLIVFSSCALSFRLLVNGGFDCSAFLLTLRTHANIQRKSCVSSDYNNKVHQEAASEKVVILVEFLSLNLFQNSLECLALTMSVKTPV